MTHPTLPKPLSGFSHVNRYWDRRMNVAAAKILPGQFYVSTQGEMIATVLGSCISACVRDRKIGIGGMNHFMLPMSGDHSSWDHNQVGAAARYGNWAMEYLINAILKAGGRREQLEVKLFGGGAVLSNMTNIGEKNIQFALDYLRQESLEVTAQDLGGVFPRKVLYFSDTGAVKLRKLKSRHNDTVEKREEEYRRSISVEPKSGDVELF
ncbi:chemoreceptor glutamine deamidase CheD [Pseudomaricurvus alkylphenolicus]|uniref:chemoreceptor glutamine deamidase CheD n=1 Tax=Pseudomaricurvus alkylphenolicus TaxID=1306991 RepID=UPI001F0D26A0|nr:chemoreceptor glutamine deamidase CheD [Pseudomaricurvus alkylphenolicus]